MIGCSGSGQTVQKQTTTHSTHKVKSQAHLNTEYKEANKLNTFNSLPSLPPTCSTSQVSLYHKATQSTKEYTRVFLAEVSKMEQQFTGFQLGMRRSQMMIFFGNGLIKRLTMIENIADCLPLYKKYLVDRKTIFDLVERETHKVN